MDQIKAHELPSQPAKRTDSRAGGYIAEYGFESWELDALKPMQLVDIITKAVEKKMDKTSWLEIKAQQEKQRAVVQAIAHSFEDVTGFLSDTLGYDLTDI